MTDSVSTEIARVHVPEDLIKAELASFGRVLPSGISKDMFATWALTMLSKALASPDEKQLRAWERVLHPANGAGLTSVVVALRECAELGLRPGSEYYLVPYGGTCQGITGYKGEIRLITNHEPSTVVARLVRQNDKYFRTGANIPPKHDYEEFGDRGPVTGGYAYVDYGAGRYSLVYALPEQSSAPDMDSFARHKAKAATAALWDQWPEQFRIKTLVHGVRKMVPWSAERKW